MSQTSTTHATPDNTTKNSNSESKKSGGMFASRMKGWREIYPAAASWEDVTFSAVVFGCVNLIFIIYLVLGLSLTSLLCYTVGLGMLVGFPYTRFTSAGRQMSANTHTELFTEDTIQKHSKIVHEKLNAYVGQLRTIFCWINVQNSFLVTGGAFAAGWLFSRISWTFLAFVAVNVALTHKPMMSFYNKNLSKQVQPYINQASAAIQGVLSKIPKMSDATAAGKKKI